MQRYGIERNDFVNCIGAIGTMNWKPASNQFIEQDAEGIDVTSRTDFSVT